MRARLLGPILAATCLALAPGAQDLERAKKLFLANCASCHGETGDGKGTTQLDRPARSFQDGGFSFGNTPEALFKTISTGIPGSPMAGFDSSLSEEERHLVAAYVVTLGPPITEVKEEDMILAVKDRPLVVRGLLPSLGEGLPEHPRGLLIGDPSGITFEYRVDDVRLLALRQGGFVKRSDWTGRGGTALEPLGKVVHLVEGGKPQGTFTLGAGTIELEARLAGSHAGKKASLSYHLVRGAHEVAHVEEAPFVVNVDGVGTGYGRSFELTGVAAKCHLALQDQTQAADARSAEDLDVPGLSGASMTALVPSGQGTALHGFSVEHGRWSRKNGVLILELEPGEHVHLTLLTIPSVTSLPQ